MEMVTVMGTKFVGWWYRLCWWTPEGKAYRACQQHGAAVYAALRRAGVADPIAEEATLLAFEVLHQQYRIGARPAHVREVALVIARAAVAEQARGPRRYVDSAPAEHSTSSDVLSTT